MAIAIIRSHEIACRVASAYEGIARALASPPMGKPTREWPLKGPRKHKGDDKRGELPLQASVQQRGVQIYRGRDFMYIMTLCLIKTTWIIVWNGK